MIKMSPNNTFLAACWLKVCKRNPFFFSHFYVSKIIDQLVVSRQDSTTKKVQIPVTNTLPQVHFIAKTLCFIKPEKSH